MRKIETLRVRPIETEFMLVTASGNMRVSASDYVGIDPNRNSRRSDAAMTGAAGFFQQDFQLRF